MNRFAAVAVVVLCAVPSPVPAQGLQLSVTTASAAVHMSPSTGSPVIGQVQRGARLEVTRELGSWVGVVWPSAADGHGYVHVSMGSLSRAPVPAVAQAPPAGTLAAEPAPLASAQPARTQPTGRMPSANPSVLSVPSHLLAVGARLGGPSFGLGAGVRAWPAGRVGVQFDVSRYATYNALDFGRMTSLQFSPGALYSFGDHVSDYTWLRPFAGGGMTFHRTRLTSPGVGFASSDSMLGYQVFGGSEVTLAGMPQVAVSLEGSYHWFGTAFPGYALGGFGIGVAGHWYFK